MLDQAAPQPADTNLLLRLKAIAEADNLAAQMDEQSLTRLGQEVIQGFDIDEGSMADWKGRMEKALNLAMLVKEDKTYPWAKAANISYPLVTSAALQYNARAYPAIVPSTDLVKAKVQGDDQNGIKAARASRVSQFLTWQLTTDTREWERGTDQLLVQLPVIGDVFRKLWWDVTQGRLRSQIRLPGKHIVVNNNATTLGNAPRVTDQIELYPYQIQTYFRTGRYVEINLPPDPSDAQKPECFLEQSCRHDLDGDGYPEPYIVTVHKDTQKVVRVVAGYDMDTIRVGGSGLVSAETSPYLIHYQFMPSFDGGFFGTGLGLLLGDISETINGALNLIMDAGHAQAMGGGFIGAQNFRIKGGPQVLRPGEYRHVNFTGDDIRKAIVDVNRPEPSSVLFQLLGLLIDAGKEITSISNVMTGDASQATMPVGTVNALIEQGLSVFTASYKRIYRALQDEFELICKLNVKYLNPQRYAAFFDKMQQQAPGQPPVPILIDPRQDFNLTDMDIVPVADPRSVTSMQKMARAQFLMELAAQGAVDPMEATRRVLDAASVEEPEALMPKQDPEMVAKQKAMMDAQEEMVVLDIKLKEMELDEKSAGILKTLAEAQKTANEADLAPMQKQIEALRGMKEVLIARREKIERGGAGRVAAASGDGVPAVRPQAGRAGEQIRAAIAALGGGGM